MNLRLVERICIAGVILAFVCMMVAYGGFGQEITMVFSWICVILLFGLLIFNLRFNRCPKCGTYLWRTKDFCTSCGENLQKYR